jgi:hypothetical protein
MNVPSLGTGRIGRMIRMGQTGLLTGLLGVAACTSDTIDCRDLAMSGDPSCAAPGNAPAFAGVEHVLRDHVGNFVVTWQPATDATTSPEKITYRVYVSRVKGRALHQAPIVSAPGATSASVSVPPGEDLYVVVRAVNEANVEDGNTVELKARSVPDDVAPTFDGLRLVTPVPSRGVKLEWSAAADDDTPAALLRYVVFGGPGDRVDYSQPLVETEPNTLEATLEKLGAPGEAWSFVVAARDVAGNLSVERKVVSSAIGNATDPPSFAGCASATVLGRTMTVSWAPATSSFAASSALSYQVFVATTSGAETFDAPTATVKDATTLDFPALDPGKTYYVVCRAIDEVGNRDANTVEKSAAISADVTAPVFGGIKTPTFDASARTVLLEWDPATDETTAAADLVYEVYESTTSGTFDFAAPPRAISAPGASSLLVDDLAPETTLYWVVRARDAALNRDANAVQASGTTLASFSRQIIPLVRKNCAVVGCHSSGFPTGGMPLSPALMYDATVNVFANQKPPGATDPMNRITPFDSANSYLYRKIAAVPGTFVASAMPASGTGNVLTPDEKDLVKRWIDQGAVRN